MTSQAKHLGLRHLIALSDRQVPVVTVAALIQSEECPHLMIFFFSFLLYVGVPASLPSDLAR